MRQLQELEVQLHAVNQELARAARPLDRTTYLNIEQRQKIGAEFRAVLARWEYVTQQISQAFGNGSAPGVSGRITTKADRDEIQ